MRKRVVFVLAAVAAFASGRLFGLEPAIEPAGSARAANSQQEYAVLRGALPSVNNVTVKDFVLEREDAKFTFASGTFYLYPAINGVVTGAVFAGQGHFSLKPQQGPEQHSLAYLAKNGALEQDFTTLLLRFTDGTGEAIAKAGTSGAPASKQAEQVAMETAKSFRQRLHQNVELRLLEDVLPRRKGSYFLASFRMGGFFTGRNVLFVVDPDESPDQVSLSTWDADTFDTWVGYPMKELVAGGNDVPVHVTEEQPDVTIERNGTLTGATETTLRVVRAGQQVLPLRLYPTLRVSGVFDAKGQPLHFVQENKEYDPQFAVILDAPAKAGETVRLLTKYAGKDAVIRDGDEMYYLSEGARDTWYPAGSNLFGDFVTFHMTFHIPKRLQIVATGKEVSRDAEPNGNVRAVWESGKPIPVAGFNLGAFRTEEAKTPSGFEIKTFANTDVPDSLAGIASQASGLLPSVGMIRNETAQGNAAIQIYSEYFGALPFDHVALTEQSACGFGQSWPMLVYLPMCAFWDGTIRHGFGLDVHDASYWDEVTPHEVAHQWWGSLVGFASYRDQWMSEGFANFSVGLYLRNTEKSMKAYRTFWGEQRRVLLEKNAEGKRPIDVGPLTMGYRVNNTKTGGWVAQSLLYSKGAYALHMLEMLYWTPKYGEEPFKQAMKRFAQDYAGKAASTEDFKASFERGLPPWLDVQKNGKLDWFFNEYVYGTELPHYVLTSDFSTDAGGETTMHFKLTQSNVSKEFVMLVPIYLEMQDGKVTRLGAATITGNDSFEKTVKIGKPPSPAKRLLVNYNGDVLSD